MKKYGKMILVAFLILLGAWLSGVFTVNVTVNYKELVSTLSTISLTIGVNMISTYNT